MNLTGEQLEKNRKDALIGFATAEIVSYIMEDGGLDEAAALDRFYSSTLSEKLEDYDTWYYKESPAYLYEIFKAENPLSRRCG
ncbi:MAG: hypothetical protein LBP68_04900 [Acidobacteriota bacterium]|jgi:hypothetical protein|nr:hypothetical protein [Acidobacteriota bacterium]